MQKLNQTHIVIINYHKEFNLRKGIILAGGSGRRLNPLTNCISKQLLPVYNKPLIYYPLTTLMLIGIKNILIIVNPGEEKLFEKLLGDGKSLGINLSYQIQEKPEGIAQAFIISENFLEGNDSVLVLGDNIFYGDNLIKKLQEASNSNNSASIFGYKVKDPERYGVIEFDKKNKVKSIIEKPQLPKSRYAVTGIYFYDNKVVEYAKKINKSERGELEITDLNNVYIKKGKLKAEIFGRGSAWFDTGTHDSLLEASNFIYSLEKRQSLKIGCPEEVAWRNKWISNKQLLNHIKSASKNDYGKYLEELITFENNY